MARPSQSFAARLKEVRKGRGWTQQDLADYLKEVGWSIDRAAIARVESGRRQVTLDEFIAVSAVLGVSPIHLMIHTTEPDSVVEVAPEWEVSARAARQWVRGQNPLRTEDRKTFYTEVSADELEERYNVTRTLLLNLAQSVVDAVSDTADQMDDQARNRIADTVDALNRELDRQQGATKAGIQ